MSRKLKKRTRKGFDADKNIITAEDLSEETLRAGNEITVWDQRCPADRQIGHGFGPANGELAEAFVEGDLVATGNGTGTDGDPVDAEIIVALTDSVQENVLARRTITDTGDLRDMTGESRNDRLVLSEMIPRASQDKYLEIRLKARPGSDGVELDAGATTDSTFKWYTHEWTG